MSKIDIQLKTNWYDGEKKEDSSITTRQASATPLWTSNLTKMGIYDCISCCIIHTVSYCITKIDVSVLYLLYHCCICCIICCICGRACDHGWCCIKCCITVFSAVSLLYHCARLCPAVSLYQGSDVSLTVSLLYRDTSNVMYRRIAQSACKGTCGHFGGCPQPQPGWE